MQPVQTFNQSLSALMKKHRITISELTRRLRFKSNTTLSRVLHAQCSPQAAEHFYQALQDTIPPVFDAQEFRDLEKALEVTRIGVAAYTANQEMWLLLENETTPSTPFPVESYGAARCVNTTQLLDFYRSVRSATIHIASSLTYPLFSEIRDLVVDLAPQENIQIHHYFSLEGDDSQIIRAVRTALPALCLPNYHGYKMSRPATLDKEFLSQSHAIARFERQDGSFGTHLIVFVANRCLLYENDEKSGLYDMMVRRILEQGRWYAPVKEEHAVERQADVLLSSKRMYLQEKDRALYCLKPDLPLAAFPYEMIGEQLMMSGAGETAMSGAMLSELKWIHMQRNRNIFEKKAPSHYIVQRSGLIRFAETGSLDSMPPEVRPLTVPERILVLSECLRRAQEHPYFKIHLAKGRLEHCAHLEVLCLDRLGVEFFKSTTGQRHPIGTVTTLSEFTRLYQDFYMEELLGKCVESEADCAQFCQQLINSLKAKL
jgi:hypothetical protein